MIRFVATDSLDQLTPDLFWATGSSSCYLAGTVEQDDEPVLMFRINKPDAIGVCRIYARPLTESDEIVEQVIQEALPRILALLQKRGARGVVFSSKSPEEIRAMKKFGFVSAGDDHRLMFSSKKGSF